jgi:PIN domain nuclease of toxin-antitoxin system
MRYLLDTCVLLWLANGESNLLSPKAQAILADSDNEIAVSVISLWELAIKSAKGKLVYPGGSVMVLTQRCADEDIDVMNVSPGQVESFLRLPTAHPDPFDRLIAAASLSQDTENFAILSIDKSFDAYTPYGVRRVW